MPAYQPNAPMTGGFAPGARVFANDGDFTQFDPCGLPRISFPLKGDSLYSLRPIVLLLATGGGTFGYEYVATNVGNFINQNDWYAFQSQIVIEQDFYGSQADYAPMSLNTPYNPAWAAGWKPGTIAVKAPFPPDLSDAFLVEEGPLEDLGGGLVKLTRTFSSLPPTRNELEQFAFTFPGFDADDAGNGGRQPYTVARPSRVQYDYFVFDFEEKLAASVPLFAQPTPNGRRLNSLTGMTPPGLILREFKVYGDDITQTVQNVSDGDVPNGVNPTTPSRAEYLAFPPAFIDLIGAASTAAELIAEASTFTRFLGNIWERRTRFVVAS